MVKAMLKLQKFVSQQGGKNCPNRVLILHVQKRSQKFGMRNASPNSKQLILKDNESAKHDLHPLAVCHLGRTHREARSRAWVSLYCMSLHMFRFPSPGDPTDHLIAYLRSKCEKSRIPRYSDVDDPTADLEQRILRRHSLQSLYLLTEAFMMGIVYPCMLAFSNIFLNERICHNLLIWRVWLIAVPEGWSRSLANDFPNSWQIGWELGDLGMPATLPVTSILM